MEYISEIHRLLKLPSPDESGSVSDGPPGLPIAAHEEFHNDAQVPENSHPPILHHDAGRLGHEITPERKSRIMGVLIYPIVFIIAFVFFYAALNFGSIVAQVKGFFTKPQAQVQLGTQNAAYEQWIQGYYFAVSDPTLLDPNNDIDHDGLTNMDEFTLGTNPIVADTDGDGYPDGIEVITGHNPLGAGLLTADETKATQSLDLSLINNRISGDTAEAASNGTVAGASTANIDLSKPGTLSIPRLNMQVPLVWSADPTDFDNDLTHGVIHYPGTALPGQSGIIYVAGHSSDYIWKKDAFAQVFTKLNYLKPGDDIFVTVTGLDGKTYNYRYQVTGSKTYKPDDQAQFVGSSGEVLNLSTCWPIGTTTNRLVVSAQRVSL